MSDYHHTRDYYAATVACLLAMDVSARVVANSVAMSVEVRLIDGSAVLWTNFTAVDRWAWHLLHDDGSISVAVTSRPGDQEVSETVLMIAHYDYPAPPVFPRVDPDELTRPVSEA